MAYVPGFQYDVFISYAHADNKPWAEDEAGWVTKLHLSLLNALPAKIGRGDGLTLYRDERLSRGEKFADALDTAFRESAVFVSILTPSYLASDWCLRELEGFCGHSSPPFGLSVGNRTRVIKVLPSPHVPDDQHPEQLRESLGYRFYALNPMTGREEQFKRTKSDAQDQRYWNTFDDLARDLAALLREMKAAAEAEARASASAVAGPGAEPRPAVVAEQTGPAVYLAEVTDDLLGQRNQVRRSLEQQGMRVLPDAQLPPTSGEYAEAVLRALSLCDVSVHMLGPHYGRGPSGDEHSFAHVQYARAADCAKSRPLARIVWLKDNLDAAQVSDEQQKAFLDELEEEKETGGGSRVELLKVGLEELKEIVVARAQPPAAEPDDNPFFYISCTPDDKEQARRILSCLREENYEGVISPHEEGADRKALLRHHKSNLKRCDVFMILYGRAPELWVQERALEARDVARLRTKKRMAMSVCAWSPPPKDTDLDIAVKNLRVWNVGDQLRCDDVKRFVRDIRRA